MNLPRNTFVKVVSLKKASMEAIAQYDFLGDCDENQPIIVKLDSDQASGQILVLADHKEQLRMQLIDGVTGKLICSQDMLRAEDNYDLSG